MFKKLMFCCLLVSAPLFNLMAAESEPAPQITFSQINDNFWVLHGGNGLGSNVGMSIGDDGIVLIDAMNSEHSDKLIKAVRSISTLPIKYVINTHQHGDHRGGNEALVALGATVIYPDYLKYGSSGGIRYAGVDRELQFHGKMNLKFNNEEFELYHVKSHTWNDVVIYVKNSNVIFTGDNHATSWGPNIGVRGLRGHQEVVDLIYRLANKKTTIVPGHTKLADLKQVRLYDEKTHRWFELIDELHQTGMSAESIVDNEEVIELLSWFHGGKFPDWLIKDRQVGRVTGAIYSIERPYAKLTEKQIQSYLGVYQLDNGDLVEIFNDQTELYAFKEKTFTAYLMARNPQSFAFNGWNESEQIDFILDQNGHPIKLNFSVNGKQMFSARKIDRTSRGK